MTLEFSVEAYSDVIEEMRLLYPAHWVEVGHNIDIVPMGINYDRYLQLESAGMLHVAIARENGILAGYCLFIIRNPQHHVGTTMAFSDLLYLKRIYRLGFNGIKFLRFASDSTSSVGAQGVYISSTSRKPFGKILEWLGFGEVERVYFKAHPK